MFFSDGFGRIAIIFSRASCFWIPKWTVFRSVSPLVMFKIPQNFPPAAALKFLNINHENFEFFLNLLNVSGRGQPGFAEGIVRFIFYLIGHF